MTDQSPLPPPVTAADRNAPTAGRVDAGTVSPTTRRRTVRAGFLGSVIEFYDYIIYGFLATVLAPQFFPSEDPGTALLSTLAVFGVGYVARPFGAVFFGWFGDRRGRRDALVLTVIGMGVATVLLGVIPTYDSVGILAPILLVVARLMQGFSAGGEVIGATTYIAENAPAERRGFLLSAAPLGAGFGTALAPLMVGVLNLVLTPEQMSDYGWRIAFLVAVPLIVVSALLRLGLEDSAEFRTIVATAKVERFPLAQVFRHHWRAVIMVVLLAMALNASSYLVSTYSNIQLTGTAGWTAKSASWLAAVVLLLALPGYLIGGRATDRFGARRVVVSGLAACCVLAFPLYLTLTNVHNPLLVGLIWLLYMLVVNTALSPAFAIYVSAFPGPVRYSGAAFAFSLGAIIGGGYTPYLASDLKSATGYVYIPAVLIVVAAIIGIATALLTRNVGERTADRLVR